MSGPEIDGLTPCGFIAESHFAGRTDPLILISHSMRRFLIEMASKPGGNRCVIQIKPNKIR